MASAPAPSGPDLGTSGGDWLFKQGDLLLGPVPARALIDKLYRGEIDATTPIARDGQETFTPIGQLEQFKLHVTKAAVKVQVDRDTVSMKVAEHRRSVFKLGGFSVLGVLVLAGGAYGAYWLAIHKPWRTQDMDDLIAINVEAPTISLATRKPDEVAVALPDPTSTAHRPKVAAKHGGRPGHRAPTPTAGPPAQADADGLASHQQFDSTAIAQIAQQKASSIYPCIMKEAKAHPPDQPVSLPLEFTVSNQGKVGKLWVDNHDYGAGTPLYACILKTLNGWKFPKYEGEQANVKLKFNWGRKH